MRQIRPLVPADVDHARDCGDLPDDGILRCKVPTDGIACGNLATHVGLLAPHGDINNAAVAGAACEFHAHWWLRQGHPSRR